MLLVITDYPSKLDMANDSLFEYGDDAWYRGLLEQGILRDDDTPYPKDSNAFSYLDVEPPLRKPAAKSFAKKYNPETLTKILEQTQPKTIVTIGQRATNLFTNVTNMDKASRTTYEYEGIPVVPVNYLSTVRDSEDAVKTLAERIMYAKQLSEGEVAIQRAKQTPFDMIEDLRSLDALLNDVERARMFAYDYETNAEAWYKEEAFATVMSVSYQPGYSFVIPLQHEESPLRDHTAAVYARIAERVHGNASVEKVAHNLWYELGFDKRAGIEYFRGTYHDTMLMAHTLDENRLVGLKPLTDQYFPDFGGYGDEVKQIASKVGWANVPMNVLAPYNANDSDLTLRLKMVFEHELITEDERHRLYTLYRNHVMPGLFTLHEMSANGIDLDRRMIEEAIERTDRVLTEKFNRLRENRTVQQYEDDTRQRLASEKIAELLEKQSNTPEHYKRWQTYADQIVHYRANPADLYPSINFNSDKQMQTLMYDYFCIPEKVVKEWTGETKRSLERDHLMKFDDPWIAEYLAYKNIKKMQGTYMKGMLKLLDENNRIHGSFKIAGTKTGRISSNDPNLQNISWYTPLADPDAQWTVAQLRKFFINRPGDDWVFLQMDYSQAELRMIANFSQDESMIDAYLGGNDLHAMTGAAIYGLSLEELMELKEAGDKAYKVKRQFGKTANFAMIYRVAVHGYKEQVRQKTGQIITDAEAERQIDAFYHRYPAILEYHAVYAAKLERFGYVRTLFGRKRRLPEIYSHDKKARNKALRQCVNAPIQGTCGEWCIYSMTWLRKRLLPEMAIVCNTVHDSVFAYVNIKYLREVCDIFEETCVMPPIAQFFDINIKRLRVPMGVDFELSLKDWSSMNEVDIKSIPRNLTRKKLEEILE